MDDDDGETSWLASVEAVLEYRFRHPALLRKALTHSSHADAPACCYQRLEFVGDAALGLLITNHLFLAYPDLDAGDLSLIRSANISTDKLARVAVRHDLYRFLRRSAPALDIKVKEFSEAIKDEDDEIPYSGSIKAPKVLADIVEALAAAVYVDCGFNLQMLWLVFRGMLEPFVTKETLQLQPVTTLFELCQKQGKQVDIKHWRKESLTVASVFVDGELVGSGSSEEKYIAKLMAAKKALQVLADSPESMSSLLGPVDNSQKSAKHQLTELCRTSGWSKPAYRVDKTVGPGHDRRFYCSVQIETPTGIVLARGEPKSRVKEAETAAAVQLLDAARSNDSGDSPHPMNLG